MLDQIPRLPGTVFDHGAYSDDFSRQADDLAGMIWTLERSQTFREPNDPSWRSFAAGAWRCSLELLEEDREMIRAEFRDSERQGVGGWRLRVIEKPLTPYVQWDPPALRILTEEDFEIRALRSKHLASLEDRGQPLEVVATRDTAFYHVQYRPDWTPCGARRITDPRVISAATTDIAGLFDRGEPLIEFVDREVVALGEPANPGLGPQPPRSAAKRRSPAAGTMKGVFPALDRSPHAPQQERCRAVLPQQPHDKSEPSAPNGRAF